MKKRITIVLLLVLFAFIYSWNQDVVTKVISLIFITIGTELMPVYFDNKKKIYKLLGKFNEDYFDLYAAYLQMHIKMTVLSFGVLFSCLYEILKKIFAYPNMIGNILVPFIFTFLITVVIEIMILYSFNKTEYNKVFYKVFKKRKYDFISDFTDEDIRIVQDELKR